MSRRKKKAALEFADEQQYRSGISILDELEGWHLPGRNTIIVDEEDIGLFEAANLKFVQRQIVSIATLPPEEQKRIRREMWPHLHSSKTGT